MAYVALKPCKFAGQSFKLGENVPAELIQQGSLKNLVKMGVIADTSNVAPAAPSTPAEPIAVVYVTLKTKEGDMPLEVTPEGLNQIFEALTSNVGDAEAIIKEMTDEDALILLNASDSRKSIKELTEARAIALSPTEDAEETEEASEE